MKVSKEGLIKFGDFTATALAAPDVDALLAGHGPAVALYLNSVAFNFDPENPPRLDRTAFSCRGHAVR